MTAQGQPGGELTGLRVAMIIDHPGLNDARAVRQVEELVHQGATMQIWATENRKDLRPLHEDAHGAMFRQFRGDSRIVGRVLRRLGQPPAADAIERRIHREVRAWSPDIIAHHEVRTLALGVEVADRLGRPLLSDLPDLPSEFGTEEQLDAGQSPPFLPKPRWHGVMQRSYARPESRMTVAPGLATLLAETYAVPEPAVLLNVPRRDTERSGAGAEGPTVRRTLGLADDVRLAVYVGDVKIGRNVEMILEALKRAPDWHLAVVGANPTSLDKYLSFHPFPAELERRVHFVPRQPDVTLPEFLADADVGVHIWRGRTYNAHHAAPNKYFAMAIAGIPLIVSGAYMSREVERLGIGIALHEPSAAGLAEALDASIARSRPTADRIAAVRDEYSWERQAAVLVRCYREALATHPPAGSSAGSSSGAAASA